MSQLAMSKSQVPWVASKDRAFSRLRIVGPIVAIIVAALVVVVMRAEARMGPEQRLEMFEAGHF
jgi:hypothetical protein